MTNKMNQDEYNDKVRRSVRLIMKMFGEDISCVSTVMVAQAEQDTAKMVNILHIIKDHVEICIDELNSLIK